MERGKKKMWRRIDWLDVVIIILIVLLAVYLIKKTYLG